MPEAEFSFGVPADRLNEPLLNMLAKLPAANILELKAPDIENEAGKKYRIANKVTLAALLGSTPTFLCDSDLVVARPVPVDCFLDSELAAKVADGLSWNGDWEYVYRSFGLPPPTRRVITTVYKDVSYPYYNSGFIFLAKPSVFGEVWYESMDRVARDRKIIDRFPYADQISFPIAAARLAITPAEMDPSFNTPIYAKEGVARSFIVHHHDRYSDLRRAFPRYIAHWSRTIPGFLETLETLDTDFDRALG